MLKENFYGEILEPEAGDGVIVVKEYEKVVFVCPKSFLMGLNQKNAVGFCIGGKRFNVQEQLLHVTQIVCTKRPVHEARYTNKTCMKTSKEIEIGFGISDGVFLRQILVCFNPNLQITLYSSFMLSKNIGVSQTSPRPPYFIQGPFYDHPNINILYTKKRQRQTINALLCLPEGSQKYIKESGNYFISRGHLSAKSDFIFGYQQNLTFYFVNVAPQWQTFNGGNWAVLEKNCRNFAQRKHLNLIIYTGTFGTSELPHVNGSQVKLYLNVQQKAKSLPVPKYYWKIVYEPLNKAGVAFVGLNNPYHSVIGSDVFCRDICSKIGWIHWDSQNIERGYGFCCEVNEFRNVVRGLPLFKVDHILN